jgi:hypothetical protein
VWRLLAKSGIDPCHHYEDDDFDDDDEKKGENPQLESSPFHTAAHQKDTGLFPSFSSVGTERIASSEWWQRRGLIFLSRCTCINRSSDLCGISVTSQSLQHGEDFPFQSAIISNSSSDVIYYHWTNSRKLWRGSARFQQSCCCYCYCCR